jgi:hypothetical protein
MSKFQKPFIDRPGILDPKPGDPEGYVTNDGMWAAIPFAGKQKGFAIIHNGKHVKECKTYKQSVDFIKKQIKIQKKTTSTLEEFL